MARVVELEVIKGLPVSPVRPIAVDKPPRGAGRRRRQAGSGGCEPRAARPRRAPHARRRGIQAHAAARTRVQMAGAASKATMATQAATAAGEEIKNTTSSAGPKIKFQHGPRRKPLRGGGTVPAWRCPLNHYRTRPTSPPGAAGDFALPTAEDIALGVRARLDEARSRATRGRGVRARVAARRA